MLELTWIKCQENVWCELALIDLTHYYFDDLWGIYILWHGGDGHAVLHVGQGFIRDELAQQRENEVIQRFNDLTLYVTFASVEEKYRNGVERFLADALCPICSKFYPNALPVEVNLPGPG